MYEIVPMEIAASGMRAQRTSMGIIASNLANARSTRTPEGDGPYKRRLAVYEASNLPAFQHMLEEVQKGESEGLSLENPERSRWLLEEHIRGVQVPRIEQDPQVRLEYDETGVHPDRDPETGMVAYPNITVVQEMTDMVSASRNYEANVAVMKNTRDMVFQLIELLRQ